MHFRAFVPEQVAFKLSGGIDRDESGCSLKKREKKRQNWAAELFKYSGGRGNSGVALGCALRRELKSGSLRHPKGSNRAPIESSSTQIERKGSSMRCEWITSKAMMGAPFLTQSRW